MMIIKTGLHLITCISGNICFTSLLKSKFKWVFYIHLKAAIKAYFFKKKIVAKMLAILESGAWTTKIHEFWIQC